MDTPMEVAAFEEREQLKAQRNVWRTKALAYWETQRELQAEVVRLRLLTAELMVQVAELRKPVAPFEVVPGAWWAPDIRFESGGYFYSAPSPSHLDDRPLWLRRAD